MKSAARLAGTQILSDRRRVQRNLNEFERSAWGENEQVAAALITESPAPEMELTTAEQKQQACGLVGVSNPVPVQSISSYKYMEKTSCIHPKIDPV